MLGLVLDLARLLGMAMTKSALLKDPVCRLSVAAVVLANKV